MKMSAAGSAFDLLPAGSSPGHPILQLAAQQGGVATTQLDELATGEATPDIIGINHYLTSERFLDHRVERYPERRGRDRTAATPMSMSRRCASPGCAPSSGPAQRLREAWERYGTADRRHRGPPRLHPRRAGALVARDVDRGRAERGTRRRHPRGHAVGDVRAVDWRSLLTRREGIYDVGAFDTRGPKPRADAGRQGRRHARPRRAVRPSGARPARLVAAARAGLYARPPFRHAAARSRRAPARS